MPEPTKPPPNRKTTTKNMSRCSWSDTDDAILLRVLKEQKDLGNQSGAGWKKAVWHAAETALAAESVTEGGPKTAAKTCDHWTNVRVYFIFLRVQTMTNCYLAQK